MNEKDFFPRTLLCNSRNELKKNLLLSSRNYPESNCNLNVFPRSITKVCNNYVDCPGMLTNHTQCRTYKLPNKCNFNPNLVHDCNYMKDIDMETRLFKINKKDKCQDLRESKYGNNKFLEKQFNTNYMLYNNTSKNIASSENVNTHTVSLNIHNKIQPEVRTLKSNIINNVCENNRLVMGNKAQYHTSENFWNNNTKRKLNTENYMPSKINLS